jgi:hypothetical protein
MKLSCRASGFRCWRSNNSRRRQLNCSGKLLVTDQPNGYTLLVSTSAQAYSAALLTDLPYDPWKDFIAIAPLTGQPYVLLAGNSTGVSSVDELTAAAKAKPAELRFGSTGVGHRLALGSREIQSRRGHIDGARAGRTGRRDRTRHRQYGRRSHRLPDGAYLSRPAPNPRRGTRCARREQRAALVSSTSGTDD